MIGISPAIGSTNGGTLLRITGTGLQSRTTATVGGFTATLNLSTTDLTRLVFITPPHSPGETDKCSPHRTVRPPASIDASLSPSPSHLISTARGAAVLVGSIGNLAHNPEQRSDQPLVRVSEPIPVAPPHPPHGSVRVGSRGQGTRACA
ncbi:MAG: IPT/TIG domain-containing protein [Acidobacteria bacterium]|nr:IPT/TIG domain-containing protein [Acidobacteriota bacterium]